MYKAMTNNPDIQIEMQAKEIEDPVKLGKKRANPEKVSFKEDKAGDDDFIALEEKQPKAQKGE
jgi:hypothetical protein